MAEEYEFTNSWFELHRRVWDDLIQRLRPSKILEIGSFEGRSTCYLIDNLSSNGILSVHCVDTWEGGIEHQPGGVAESDMSAVEARFHRNTDLAVSRTVHPVNLIVDKARSVVALSRLIADDAGEFDLIYIDGSHQASDVLVDAILSFELLKLGSVMIFDDYIWNEANLKAIDPLRSPKIAIDSFTTIFARKLRIIPAESNYQVYVEKVLN